MARTPLDELRARLDGKTQTQVAAELGISQPYLSEILAGGRAIPRRVLDELGFERAVVYRPKKVAGDSTSA